MDNFAVDLDKVLNDFEENETVSALLEDGENGVASLSHNISDGFTEGNDISGMQDIRQLICEETDTTLHEKDMGFYDISEIDEPVVTSNNDVTLLHDMENIACNEYLNIDSQQGYFVPEDMKSTVGEERKALSAAKDIPKTSRNEANKVDNIVGDIYTGDKPEIVMAASELQSHLREQEDRPSFMSSSPAESFTDSEPSQVLSDVNKSDNYCLGAEKYPKLGEQLQTEQNTSLPLTILHDQSNDPKDGYKKTDITNVSVDGFCLAKTSNNFGEMIHGHNTELVHNTNISTVIEVINKKDTVLQNVIEDYNDSESSSNNSMYVNIKSEGSTLTAIPDEVTVASTNSMLHTDCSDHNDITNIITSIDLNAIATEVEEELAIVEKDVSPHKNNMTDSVKNIQPASRSDEKLDVIDYLQLELEQNGNNIHEVDDSAEGNVDEGMEKKGDLETFLAPSCSNQCIVTSMEGTGLTKVPEFSCDLKNAEEQCQSENPVVEDFMTNSNLPQSVRPKDTFACSLESPNVAKKPRPSSLCGLSLPKLPEAIKTENIEDRSPADFDSVQNFSSEHNLSTELITHNGDHKEVCTQSEVRYSEKAVQEEPHVSYTFATDVQDSLEMPAGLMLSPNRSASVIPPLSSCNPSFTITDLGKRPPTWLPDCDAPNCMQCDARFTFTKRRHHCRACGKVFCSTCCNLKSRLHYLESREGRVCSKCFQDLIRAQVFERMETNTSSALTCDHSDNNKQQQLVARPNLEQNHQSEFSASQQNKETEPCSLDATQELSVMVPAGVLRRKGSQKKENRESKQVMFSDGIKPGGDLTELDGNSLDVVSSQKINQKSPKFLKNGISHLKDGRISLNHFLPDVGLPPIFSYMGDNGEIIKEDNPNMEIIMLQLKNAETTNPVTFMINKNLLIMVKLVNLDCCLNKKCICFTSKGLCTVGQSEIVLVLECECDEETIPLDIFKHFQNLYEQASKGITVSNMDHSVLNLETERNQPSPVSDREYVCGTFLGSQEHGGFLYLTPSFQCMNKLVIPQKPFLFAVLLQKWELPWAKVFPLRLMLRLGAEFRYYPCPIVSVRRRKPVYGEIGHTIMNLLVDFRNYQYSIPQVPGFTIEMKDRKTYLNFPRNKYQQVLKVLSSSNEHVIAIGANFSEDSDSYLVCIQNDDGNYQTQAINIQNKPRKVTGAAFVVFNGALKSGMGVSAKSSIVEDGLMVQVLPDIMVSLKECLKDMKDLTIPCGSSEMLEKHIGDTKEEVIIKWVTDEKSNNLGLKSPIDKLSLDGVENIHIHNIEDYEGPQNKAIRWVEVYFLQNDDQRSRLEPVDLSRLADALARATCQALAPLLCNLVDADIKKIGLRAKLNNENVGYQAGSNGQNLPDLYMNNLDNELIPVIHNAASQNRGSTVTLELIFYIINT